MKNTIFRIDRFATLYFFCPLIKYVPFKKIFHIPFLMYHSISDDTEQEVHPYFKVNTSPETFNEHMKFLNENNYTVISLYNIGEKLKSKETDKKCVVITFDDGFQDFYTNAFPILEKYRFTATMFLPAAYINDKKNSFKGKEYLNWREIRELHGNNVTFGSHTMTHPKLVSLTETEVKNELCESKKVIEDKIGTPIETFSYPFAFPEENKNFKYFIKKTLQGCGYKIGVTTILGTVSPNDDPYLLKRIPVNSCDDLAFFKAKLSGAYNWLHTPQLLFKRTKRIFS